MNRERLLRFVVAVVIVVVVILTFVASCLVQLRPGEIIVLYDPITKSLSGPYVGPTIVFRLPWQGIIRDFYTIDIIDMTSDPLADYRPVSALTKDGVEITVEMSFTYSIDPNGFIDLVKHYPRIDYEEQNMVPSMRQIVRDVIAKYTVEEIIMNREQIAKEIAKAYRSEIENDITLKAIKLHEVNLRAIKLPERIKAAIEEKIAAYQQRLAAEYIRERELILANATAMKSILIAKGEADALLIRVSALQQSLKMLYEISGDVELLRTYLAYEQLSRLKGAIIIVGGAGATPLIQLPPTYNLTRTKG